MPAVAHPAEHERVGLALLRGQEDAREAPFELGQSSERFTTVEYTLRVECGERGGMSGNGDFRLGWHIHG